MQWRNTCVMIRRIRFADFRSAKYLITSRRSLSCQPYRVAQSKRASLIFGANTDVGKTVISTGLVRASLDRGDSVHYIKPLQCGGSDQSFVEKYVQPEHMAKLSATTLFRWETPSSPHTASMIENQPCSDSDVLSTLRSTMSEVSLADGASTVYVETAGGVMSPSSASPLNAAPRHAKTQKTDDRWGWTTQANLYQPILGYCPVVLVGDGRLGGISCTLSALESLVLRGYDVAAVVLIETQDSYGNIDALHDYASTRSFKLHSGTGESLFEFPSQCMVALPPIPLDPNEPLWHWYDSIEVRNIFARLDSYLQNSWKGQVQDLNMLKNNGQGRENVVWWPGSTHFNGETILIDSASGCDFNVVLTDGGDTKQLMHSSAQDASASWWTQGIGHGESNMALSVAAAAGRYGHVSASSGIIHAPAVNLAQTLVGQSGPGNEWASRVFFSDDGGSSAVEIALRIGIKMCQSRMGLSKNEADQNRWIVCSLDDCFHGDTLGALNIAQPYFDRDHPWYKEKGYSLETPTIGFRDGELIISFPDCMKPADEENRIFASISEIMDVKARKLTRLLPLYKEYIEMLWIAHEHSSQHKIGSVVLEPVLQCAGGMKFIDPLWQVAIVEIARLRNIPVIYDESTVGLYRLGVTSCRELLGINPDIAIYSKLLTGGVLPLSATLCREEAFTVFSNEDMEQCFLNGNTFVAPAIACASALQALSTYKQQMDSGDGTKGGNIAASCVFFEEALVRRLSKHSLVQQCFTLGSVISLELIDEDDATTLSYSDLVIEILKDYGILARCNHNVVSVMLSPLSCKTEYARTALLLEKAVEQLGRSKNRR